MHLLPTHLAPLASHCAKESQVRFGATGGVKIELSGEAPGRFAAVATDGRRLIRVIGDCVETGTTPITAADGTLTHEPIKYPPLAPLDSAPNGELSSIIPAADWKKAFTDAAKLTGRACKPMLRSLPIVCGKDVTTLACTDLDRIAFHQPKNIDGRFPRWEQVIPADAPHYSIMVDPIMLAETLTTLSKLGTSTEHIGVKLEFQRDPGRPFVLRKYDPSLDLLAVIVPLTMKDNKKTTDIDETTVADQRTIDEHRAALENASRNIETLREELTQEQLRSANWKEIAEAARERATDADWSAKRIAALESMTEEAHRQIDALTAQRDQAENAEQAKQIEALTNRAAQLEEQNAAYLDDLENARTEIASLRKECERITELEGRQDTDAHRLTLAWRRIETQETELTRLRAESTAKTPNAAHADALKSIIETLSPLRPAPGCLAHDAVSIAREALK